MSTLINISVFGIEKEIDLQGAGQKEIECLVTRLRTGRWTCKEGPKRGKGRKAGGESVLKES